MAKITHPLFSVAASGALGRNIIFGTTTGTRIAKRWHQPSGAPSAAQTARRNAYAAAADAWALLDAPTKSNWTATGEMRQITGFNAFMADVLKNNPTSGGVTWEAGAGPWDGGGVIWVN